MYQADPNDNTKQIPRGLSAKVFSHAETPAAETVTKNPSYILINQSGSYAFLYDNTGSLGGTIDSRGGYITGSVIDLGVHGLPVKLDINPRAWRKTEGTAQVGEVTFIYRGQ